MRIIFTVGLVMIELRPGKTQVTIEVVEQPGEAVCEVHSLILERME